MLGLQCKPYARFTLTGTAWHSSSGLHSGITIGNSNFEGSDTQMWSENREHFLQL